MEIKDKLKEKYGKRELFGKSELCYVSSECFNMDNVTNSQLSTVNVIGYNSEESVSTPSSFILGVGSSNTTKFAHIGE